MAAFTSQRTGSWNDTSTSSPWYVSGSTPCPIPGSGDTATIASPHVVTIPDGYTATVGTTTGTTGTTALTVSSGGKLTIGGGASGALNLQGDLVYNGTGDPVVLMNAGSQLRFVPASAQQIKVNAASGNGCTFKIAGSSGARCSVLTDPTAITGGGLKGYFALAATANKQGSVFVDHCDFTDVGDSTHAALGCFNVTSNVANPLTITNNTFTRCGLAGGFDQNGNSAGAITFSGNTFTSSVGGTASGVTCCASLQVNNAPTGGATRVMSGNAFDLKVSCASTLAGFTVQYNVFGDTIAGNSGTFSAFDQNYFPMGSGGSAQLGVVGDITNNYITSSAATNPHYLTASTAGTYSVTGNVCECTASSDGNGDFLVQSGSAASNLLIRYNLILPDAGGKDSGVLYTGSATAASGAAATIEHNTAFFSGGNNFASDFGETQAGAANIVNSYKGNLFWNSSSGSWLKANSATGSATDYCSAANADYNAGWNHSAGTSGNGYSLFLSSGTPGTHDVSGNPSFVDSTRNIGSWAVSVGQALSGDTYATKVTKAVAYLSTSPTTLIPALMSWVRAGFRPQNSAYQAASYPGDASTADAAGNAWPGGSPGIGAMALLVWSYVQGTGNASTGAAASVAATPGASVTAGNLVVVGCNTNMPTTLAVSDSAGNTYTQAATLTWGTNGQRISLFYAQASTTGSLTVTATPGASSTIGLSVDEFKCNAGAWSLDTQGTGSDGGTLGTSLSAGTLTLTGTDVVIGLGRLQQNHSTLTYPWTAGSGYTLTYAQQGTGNVNDQATEYALNLTSSASPTLSATGNASNWGMAATAFRAGSAAPAATAHNLTLMGCGN
jgi:hypothetical protein